MKSRKWMIVAGSVGALVLVLGIVGVIGAVGVAHAQTDDEGEGLLSPQGGLYQGGGPFGGGRFRGRMVGGPMHGGPFPGAPLHQGLDVVAGALGLTEDEVVEALRDGQTVAELANQQGMDLEAVVTAVIDAAEARLAEAVENGRLTEEQASQILSRLGEDLPERFQEPWEPRGPQSGLLGQFGEGFWTRYDAVAEALGLDPEVLFSELHGGKTVPEVAEDQGVDVDEIRQALEGARAEMMEERILQAVEDGRISEEQAEWMLEGLESGFLPRGGSPNRGPGGGPRGGSAGGPGCGGRGRGMGW